MKNIIDSIEFQISNFCNRKCEWCPPFRDNNIEKIEYTNEKIINIIKEYYDKNIINLNNCVFSIGRYGEPTYNINVLLNFLKKLRKEFPTNYISLDTNGDYLKELINNSNIFMLNRIIISRYVKENFYLALYNIFKIFDKHKIKNMEFNKKSKYIKFTYDNILIKYRYEYHTTMKLYSRGSLVDTSINGAKYKSDICKMAGKAIMIDYNGLTYPCCELSSMNKNHLNLNCGNILYDSIDEILLNLNKFKNKNYQACKKCNLDGEKILYD